MPIYEYQCTACKATFEELVRTDAAGRTVACPACGGREAVRQPSVFSAHRAPASRAAGCVSCPNAGGTCPMAEQT